MKKVALMFIITITSMGLGFYKEIVVIRVLGVGPLSDSFVFLSTLPFIIFSAVSGIILSSLIPSYIKIEEKNGHDEANAFAYLFLVVLLIPFIGGAILFYLNPAILLSFFAPGLSSSNEILGSIKMLGFSFMIFVYVYVMAAIFSARNDNIINTFIQIPFHLSIITLLSFFSDMNYIALVSIYVGLGIILVFTILKKRKFNININRPTLISVRELKLLLKGLPLISLSAISPAIITFSINRFASQMDEGLLTLINFSNKIFLSSYSAVGYILILYFYPIFSRLAIKGENDKLQIKLIESLKISLRITIPIIVGVIVYRLNLSEIIIYILNLDDEYTRKISIMISILMPSLLFLVVKDLLLRFLLAIGNIKVLAINGVFSILVFYISYYLLNILFEEYTLLLSLTMVHFCGVVYLIFYIYLKYKNKYLFKNTSINKEFIRSIIMQVIYIFVTNIIYAYSFKIGILLIVIFGFYWFYSLKTEINKSIS